MIWAAHLFCLIFFLPGLLVTIPLHLVMDFHAFISGR